MNLTALWNYMQVDLEADRFGSEMKQSAKRKLLMKDTEILKEQQALFAKAESEIEAMNAHLAELTAESQRLAGLLNQFEAEIGNVEDIGEDQLEEKILNAQKLMDTMIACERDLARVRKEADANDKNQTEIKRRAAKVKTEYDAVKKEYDIEFANDKIRLKQLRDAAEKEAAKLDKADLEKYRQIKLHCTPPMAKLLNNQCTGCFMTLPIGTLREIKASGEAHTCDNCGRLLYPQD